MRKPLPGGDAVLFIVRERETGKDWRKDPRTAKYTHGDHGRKRTAP